MIPNPTNSPPPAAARPRHRGRWLLLVAGTGMVWLSELFFLPSGTQAAVLFGGMLLAGAAWVGVAMLGWRSALAGAVFATLSAWLLIQCEPALRKQSFQIYFQAHRQELTEIVGIMRPVKMERRNRARTPCDLPGLPPSDCARLTASMRRSGAYFVWKEGDATAFELWRWVDSRGGIRHCPGRSAERCEEHGHRLGGDWFSATF